MTARRRGGGADLLEEMARILATFQGRTGFHGSGRHISTDFDLCGAYDGSDGTAPRPCSPRCAAVAAAIQAAADELGMTVDELRVWPKPRRGRNSPEMLKPSRGLRTKGVISRAS